MTSRRLTDSRSQGSRFNGSFIQQLSDTERKPYLTILKISRSQDGLEEMRCMFNSRITETQLKLGVF